MKLGDRATLHSVYGAIGERSGGQAWGSSKY